MSAEIESIEHGDAADGGMPGAKGERAGVVYSQASGLHSRLTLQRSHTIYHVGAREIPTQTLITQSMLDHLHDLCLRLLSDEERTRVILVTSEPAAAAAKSFVAAQLATLLSADYGPNVLAMEAELNAPGLHKALGFVAPRGYGLDEQLGRLSANQTGRVSIVQLNQRLAALVAGEPSRFDSEKQACFQAVLAQLRSEHEYVILDGPALDPAANLDHLQQVDGVLFVSSEGSKLTQTLATVAEHLPRKSLIRIVEIAPATAPRASWRAARLKR